jgi:hypothetical protein
MTPKRKKQREITSDQQMRIVALKNNTLLTKDWVPGLRNSSLKDFMRLWVTKHQLNLPVQKINCQKWTSCTHN